MGSEAIGCKERAVVKTCTACVMRSACDTLSLNMFAKEICGRGQSVVQSKLVATHVDQDFGLT